ncbi:MAG: hypothetical protein Q8O22_08320 [Candidatus Omnitrophota bacterium]|nr:hypothetical protein [Candidatus Omnitrophota bacterium]
MKKRLSELISLSGELKILVVRNYQSDENNFTYFTTYHVITRGSKTPKPYIIEAF